jgi:deaminated glutathione amidase
MKIASLQMVSGCSLEQNLDKAHQLIRQAAEQNCQIAVLPEYFCMLGRKDVDKLSIQEPFGNGPIQDRMAKIAQENGIYVVAGTMPISSDHPDKVFNSTLVFANDGATILRYDKIHLFSFTSGDESYNEAKTLIPGQKIAQFELVDNQLTWRFGLSICYDLRFPELYRAIGAVDAHLMPAAFTYTTGQVHWDVLIRARAIENQSYFVASAQGGSHENGRKTWGHSMIVDPWGKVCKVLEENAGIITQELSQTEIHEIRNKLPALQHRTLR